MSLHDLLIVAAGLNIFAAVAQVLIVLIENQGEKRFLSAVSAGTCFIYAAICYLASGIV